MHIVHFYLSIPQRVGPTVQAQIKQNIEAPRRRPLWEDSTDDQWIPIKQGQ